MIAATILDTPDSVSANPFAKEQALRLNRLLPLHLAALSKRSATGQRLHYQCHLPADQIGGQLRQPILAIISEAILDRHVVTLDEPASEMVVQGFSNREIAQRLGIAEGTVKFQLHRIYERLGVRNRVALAALIFTDRAN